MKILISGGRNFKLNKAGLSLLNELYFKHRFSMLISGAARGIDSSCEEWADTKEIPIERHYPDYSSGKAGPVLRNQKMVDLLTKNDLVCIFPGGRGTADCARRAERAGLNILDLRERLDLVEET